MRHASRAQVQAMHWPLLEPIEPDDAAIAAEKPAMNPIALSKPVCVAGARSRVNLALESPLVSRAHALFVTEAERVYVRDLASLNHLYLNDAAVREMALHDGDVLRIGPFSFRCQGNFPPSGNGHTPPAQLQQVGTDYLAGVTGRSAVIGSRQGCDVQLTDSAVEPVHAVIFHREGHWHLRDLRSSTGTYVNDELVEPALEDSTIPLLDDALMAEPLQKAPEEPQTIAPAPALAAPATHVPSAADEDRPIPVHHEPEGERELISTEVSSVESEGLPVGPELAIPAPVSGTDEMSHSLPDEAGGLPPAEQPIGEKSINSKPRRDLENQFSEILDDLSANVEQLHSKRGS